MDNIVTKSKKDIETLLLKIKNIDDKSFILLNRSNNKDPDIFLVEIGYDYGDLISEIKNLSVYDFLRCQVDYKYNFYLMYSFIKKIKEYIVYIKLSVVKKKTDFVYIISFHKAEKNELSLRPFKEGKNG